MKGYDPNQHPFPPALVVKSVFSDQPPITEAVASMATAAPRCSDTCATEPEPLSNLLRLQLEPSTDEPKGICGTPYTEGKSEAKPMGLQIGGKHYKAMKIQPVEYIHANQIPFMEGSIIKYISRWRQKNGLQDLLKAKHFIDLLIELEENNAK